MANPNFIGVSMARGAAHIAGTSKSRTDDAAAPGHVMAATSKIVSSGGIPAPKTKLASWIQPALAARISPEAVKVEPNILLNLLDKTTTQLARGAVNQLKGVSQAVLSEAVNTVKNKKIKPELLMNYLERKVRIGEVLNDMAKDWDRETKEDFTQALNMEPKKVDVMDSIVSLAILNDPELENDLRVENMDEGDGAKLLENRRITWQYPPPGTPLDPPYVVLVAVEHQDFSDAQETIDDIFRQLRVEDGFRIPGSPRPSRQPPVMRMDLPKNMIISKTVKR